MHMQTPQLWHCLCAHAGDMNAMPLEAFTGDTLRCGDSKEIEHAASQHTQHAVAWGGTEHQVEDNTGLSARPSNSRHEHVLTSTKSWTAYCSDSDESDASCSASDSYSHPTQDTESTQQPS